MEFLKLFRCFKVENVVSKLICISNSKIMIPSLVILFLSNVSNAKIVILRSVILFLNDVSNYHWSNVPITVWTDKDFNSILSITRNQDSWYYYRTRTKSDSWNQFNIYSLETFRKIDVVLDSSPTPRKDTLIFYPENTLKLLKIVDIETFQ